MKSKSSSKQINSISSFIDSLLSPPTLNNPLKKPTSQKSRNDSIAISKEATPPEQNNPFLKPSPVKIKAKSEDKASQIFSNSKSYVQQMSLDNSMINSHLSEASQSRTKGGHSSRQVRFRQNLIMRNSHYKKQFARQDSRTPSILKRSQMVRNSTIQFMQASIIQSRLPSNIQRQPSNIAQDREGRALKTNEVVKKRYLTILQRFETKFANKLKKKIVLRNEEKYKDQLFPPILSSILRGGAKINQNKTEPFKWIRITDLFKDQKLVIVNDDQRSNLVVRCGGNCNCNNFIGNAFSCIRKCKSVLSRMFQSFQMNDFGVYLVKIFQQNVWKYIIVDDFIPVTENYMGEIQPYFIHCKKISQEGNLEIWPFLLEKAYANYYANYQSLHYGNTLDFMQEITGISAQSFRYDSNPKRHTESITRLQKLIETQDTIFLGFIQSENTYIPIQKNDYSSLTADVSKQSSPLTLNSTNIYDFFAKVYVFNPRNWIYSTVSSVGINIKKSSDIPRFDISVRTFKLSQAGLISISIRQKQKRFYQRSSLNYDYIWIRAILLQKQFDGDCRWIDAKYSNCKTINFFKKLEVGQYYVILLPEWKSSHCYELSLILNSSVSVVLSKKEYDDRDLLIEKGCCDLAQRYGKLHQINLFACNYSYINQQIGMLVQNINNERYNGDIKINRSINGLKAAVDLVPFNVEFYQNKNHKLPFKTQISVYIGVDKSYTVVLIMRGGIDLPFLKKFDFGK